MKRYFMGIAALLLAVGFTAFTNRPLTNVTLKFTGNTSSSADVTTESLWRETSVSCPSGNVQACMIVTDINNTKVISGPFRVLDDSKVTLGAASNDGNLHYIPTGNASLVAITNQP